MMTTPSSLYTRIQWSIHSPPTIPKSSPGSQEAQHMIGSRPSSMVRPIRGPPRTHGAISASLEASPPRPSTAHHISASLESRDLPSESRQSPPRSRPPRPSPPRGLGSGGNSASLEATLDRQNKQPICSPTRLTEAFNANHSTAERGVSRHQATIPHSRCDWSPVR